MSLQFGRGGHRNRGGKGQTSARRAEYGDVPKTNELYERYYNELDILPEEDKDAFWESLRRELPNSFRFTGSKGLVLLLRKTALLLIL